MSTPAGKPQNPIDLAAYVSHKARERYQGQSEAEPLASAAAAPSTVPEHDEHAPEAWEPRDTEASASSQPYRQPRPGTDDEAHALAGEPQADPGPSEFESLQSEPDDGSSWDAGDEHPSLSPISPAERESALRPAASAHSHPQDLDEVAPLQPRLARPAPFQETASGVENKRFSDDDLDRLEASLRWLQHQEASLRLPRGPSLPPMQGLSASTGARGRRYGEDVLARGVRSARSLEPERMAPPPHRGGSRLPATLALLSACVAIAALGYYLAAGGSRRAEPVSEPRLASVNPMYTPTVAVERSEPVVAVAPVERAASIEGRAAARLGERLQEAGRPLADPAPLPQPPVPEAAAPQAPQVQAPQALALQQMQPQPQPQAQRLPAPAAVPPVVPGPQRTVDSEEIKVLMKQGEQFIATGDLITARKLFQRAAEAGDANGAIALGATYDPIVLERLGVVGLAAADLEKARTWYQTAERLGSREAARRLQILANR